MEIINMKCTLCPICGMEAKGFDEINEKFGYRIKNRKEIAPHQCCKACRGEQDEDLKTRKAEKELAWTLKYYTASRWAREIGMGVAEFEKYLWELGYLKECSNSNQKKFLELLTEKGKEHTKIRTIFGRKIVLWNFMTFAEILKRDADSYVGLLVCPKCKNISGELSDEHLAFGNIEKCQHCGYIGKDRIVEFKKR